MSTKRILQDDAEEDAEYRGKFSPKYAKKVEKEFAKQNVRLRSPDGKLGVKLPPGNKDEIEDYKKRGYVEDNEFDDFDIGPQSDENIPDDYEDVLDALVDDDKKKHAMKKLNGEDGDRVDVALAKGDIDERDAREIKRLRDEDEERIVMQPMLETCKTDTSVYLTEQSASDKRNKKTEVKNQSFKERYKPKTHWQLEELRRYGL